MIRELSSRIESTILKKGAKMNSLGPRTSGGSGWRMAFRCYSVVAHAHAIVANDGDWTTRVLGHTILSLSEAGRPASVAPGAVIVVDQPHAYLHERERDRLFGEMRERREKR